MDYEVCLQLTKQLLIAYSSYCAGALGILVNTRPSGKSMTVIDYCPVTFPVGGANSYDYMHPSLSLISMHQYKES